MPLDGFTPDKLANLTKMVLAKEELLKLALGVGDIPIQMPGDRLAFPWFLPCDNSDYMAYAQFIAALCKTAKAKQRVTAKAHEDYSNPKFSMRCWLISLGLSGDEFATPTRTAARRTRWTAKPPIFHRSPRQKPTATRFCRIARA
jgi:hypothetical protein